MFRRIPERPLSCFHTGMASYGTPVTSNVTQAAVNLGQSLLKRELLVTRNGALQDGQVLATAALQYGPIATCSAPTCQHELWQIQI
jgi:hypothetical protein